MEEYPSNNYAQNQYSVLRENVVGLRVNFLNIFLQSKDISLMQNLISSLLAFLIYPIWVGYGINPKLKEEENDIGNNYFS